MTTDNNFTDYFIFITVFPENVFNIPEYFYKKNHYLILLIRKNNFWNWKIINLKLCCNIITISIFLGTIRFAYAILSRSIYWNQIFSASIPIGVDHCEWYMHTYFPNVIDKFKGIDRRETFRRIIFLGGTTLCASFHYSVSQWNFVSLDCEMSKGRIQRIIPSEYGFDCSCEYNL